MVARRVVVTADEIHHRVAHAVRDHPEGAALAVGLAAAVATAIGSAVGGRNDFIRHLTGGLGIPVRPGAVVARNVEGAAEVLAGRFDQVVGNHRPSNCERCCSWCRCRCPSACNEQKSNTVQHVTDQPLRAAKTPVSRERELVSCLPRMLIMTGLDGGQPAHTACAGGIVPGMMIRAARHQDFSLSL